MNNSALKEAVARFIEQLGFIFLDLQVTWSQEEWKIRGAIFKQPGITLKDCAEVTRALRNYLVGWLGNEDFSIDISSPGAERVLKTPLEFSIFQGKRVKVVFKDGMVGFYLLMGWNEMNETMTVFSEEKQAVQDIPIQEIAKCQLVL